MAIFNCYVSSPEGMGLGWVSLFQPKKSPIPLGGAAGASSRHAASSSRGGGVQGLVAVRCHGAAPVLTAELQTTRGFHSGSWFLYVTKHVTITYSHHIRYITGLYFVQLMTGTRLDLFGMVASIFDDPPLDQPNPPNGHGPRTECSQVEALVVERNLLEEENRCLP